MTAATGLDHVGLLTRDGPALWGLYERLGFTLTPVARQSSDRGPLGTGNRCAMLRQGYLELLALLDPALPDNGAAGLLGRFEGAHILALGMEDAPGNLSRLRRAGVAIPGIAPLSRPAGEGDAVARFERLPLPEAPEGRVQLVRHLTADLLWHPRWTEHANGATELREAIVASDRPAESAARLSRLAGLPLEPDPAGGYALSLPAGRVRILPPDAVAALLPGVEAPALPAIVGIVLGAADLGATRRHLGHLPLREAPLTAKSGGVMVPPSHAGGVALAFSG